MSPSIFITISIKSDDQLSGIRHRNLNTRNENKQLEIADDIDLIEASKEEPQEMLRTITDREKQAGLRINIDKTHTMVFG